MIALMAFSLFLFISAYNDSFVFDEAYSMAMIQHSYSEIWNITAADVHPPLYYYMLKSFTLLFGNSLLTLRIFSTLGVLGVFMLGMISIRRYFGASVALVFIVIITLLPVTQYLADEIRMYSWTMFFTLANAIAAYKVFRNSTLLNNLVLLLMALCASYTHYYSLMGTATIFGILLFFLIINKRQTGYTIGAIILFIIGYSIWIPELINQVTAVNHSYWITGLTLKDLLLFTYYLFSPKEPTHPYTIFTLPVMAVALSFMLLLIIAIAGVTIKEYKKLNRTKTITALTFMAVFFIPVISAIFISYVMKPIIIPRYMTCLLGCLVLGISILLVELYESGEKRIRTLLLTSIFMLSVLSVARFFSEKQHMEETNKEYYEIEKYFKGKNTEKTVFISTFSACGWLGMLSIMYPSPNNLYLVYSEKKTPVSYKPFKLIEVNTLPKDFDFHYTQSFDENMEQTKINNHFMNGVKADYLIEDSLIQITHPQKFEGKEIYLMKTIHREKEKQ
ncbi:dolichyl-phosphate-mannose-protein mannosyltransferase [Dysgonomonas alginatilytica]|uniref:Dolichyl-phosphate-mannose-protein mannosyltransferase n=2 Tax=Dysgonomonas alginatilytica TaxID=1605892 RepID=A0A2V3PLN3_9BACT|nr:dolichyl-phosphate-mannose-protein mannosyltransferase [Dysgonomonas alginatilytica]